MVCPAFRRPCPTPYNTQEGGYQYIWGGPYNAAEELSSEFDGLVSEQLIEEVAEEVESDGIIDWAPGTYHPDQQTRRAEWEAEQRPDDGEEPEPDLDAIIRSLEGGLKPSYGGNGEVERRRDLLARLDRLRQALTAVTPTHGGLGHNNPPAEEDTPQVNAIIEVRAASDVIREELNKPEPDALAVAHATSRLKTSLSWFAKKMDVAAESFAKAIGDTTGKAVVAVAGASLVSPPFRTLIVDVVNYASQWLSHVLTWPY